MQNEVLADRLSNDSDALVAAMFVFMSGLGAAVGDLDIRCALAESASLMIGVSIGGCGLVLYALRWLRIWSARLRGDIVLSGVVTSVQRRLDRVRIVLVCLFALGACFLLFVAKRDAACLATA